MQTLEDCIVDSENFGSDHNLDMEAPPAEPGIPAGTSRPTDVPEDIEELARPEKERRKQRRVSTDVRDSFADGAQPPPPPPSDQPLPGRLFATLDATDSARFAACLAPGVLTTAVEDLPLGLEARRQYDLVVRSGGVVRAHSLAVCPFDILVDRGEDLELCEFKAGREPERGTYGLVPDGVGVEEIHLTAKDVSKMCGVDLLEVQNDRPDGMRTLAVAHGQLALISTETVARAFAAGPALARNIFRRHNPVSGTCNADYFAVDDASMSNVLVSRFDDDVVVVLTTTLGGDLVTIEVYRDVVFSSPHIRTLGDANVSFKTIAEFERDTSLKIDGHDVDFAMLGAGAVKVIMNFAKGSQFHVSNFDDADLGAKLKKKLLDDARNDYFHKNLLIPKHFIDSYQPSTYLAAFAAPALNRDSDDHEKAREEALDILGKLDGSSVAWASRDLRFRRVTEASLRATAAHYAAIEFDPGDVRGRGPGRQTVIRFDASVSRARAPDAARVLRARSERRSLVQKSAETSGKQERSEPRN